ncbi:MAG: DNA translocase FtsK [Candidatus Omnitrophica bacterium]|nr:DNA translocase FtsK [Candidatus Omnitrophota bacterium]
MEQIERKTLERWIKGLIVFAACLYLFFCLISFSPYDPTFKFARLASPLSHSVENFGGRLGAYLAGFLFYVFGKASYLFILLLLLSGYNLIWGEKVGIWRKVLSSGGLVLVISVFLSMHNGYNSSGGILGLLLGPPMQEYFGRNGIYMILILAGLGSLASGYKVFLAPFKEAFDYYREVRREMIPLPEEGSTEKKEKKPRERKIRPVVVEEAKNKEIEVKEEKGKPVPPVQTPSRPLKIKGYKLPPLDILNAGTPAQQETEEDLERYAQVIEETLLEFGIEGEVVEISQGPRVTMYEVQLAPGIPIQKVHSIQDNIAMNLKTTSIRVVAPLPNKSTVGIEVPNREISIVSLREVLSSREFQKSPSKLTIAIGKNIMGKPVITDMTILPHILIAGATGSGKTVCINSLITSILFKASPDEVKFIMIDPKMVELTCYNGLPHLLCPVIVDIKDAVNTLKWLIGEMTRRYKLFSDTRVRNIEAYNALKDVEPLSYIVVVIDELADLMMIARQEIENSIIRLAQLSRAAGIHLILATQRPSVNVITGVIKANLPCRISFQVTSKFDSRTILDRIGAEKLLGRGDLLFIPPGSSSLMRIQGCLVSDDEIEKVCEFIKAQKTPEYKMEIVEGTHGEGKQGELISVSLSGDDEESLYQEAKRIVITTRIASISMLQRRLKVGFNKAARFIERMEEEGIVGPYREGKPRRVIVPGEMEDGEVTDK